MDIDRAKRQGLCFNCQERGHLAKDCPKPRRVLQHQVQQVVVDPETMTEEDYQMVVNHWEQRKIQKVNFYHLDEIKESEVQELKKKLEGF